MPRRDIAELRRISILQAAQALGIELKRTGCGSWHVKDANDPIGYTSLSISESKNFWKRWSGKTSGGVSKGGVIDFVMHIRDCDFKTAVDILSSRFP
ncbi:MAG: hypothetical protein WCV62_02585 [Candidatus Peribacteraceae bacterium]|jgi:hypothetical protein